MRQDGEVTATGRAKGMEERGGERRSEEERASVQVSGTDYPWEAINLSRDSDTPPHGESSPLLTSCLFLKSSHLPKHHLFCRGSCFKYQEFTNFLTTKHNQKNPRAQNNPSSMKPCRVCLQGLSKLSHTVATNQEGGRGSQVL